MPEDNVGSMVEARETTASTILQQRSGERLVALEVKQNVIEQNTEVIRVRLHELANKMQEFVILEQRCVAALEAINAQNKEHHTKLDNLSNQVLDLTQTKFRIEGAWSGAVRVTLIVVGILGGLSALVSAVAWAVLHLSIHLAGN